ncbi:hypothetical protein [Burkholderia gladioli]|uniref:hypothetical protein n=1 Tax=Burkholderia gladioli TaxID=28095 RepID=UPI001FC84B89|nr:hypothetical protein [Burkholderia gladioli]
MRAIAFSTRLRAMPISASTTARARPNTIDRTANLTVRTAPCASTGSESTSRDGIDMWGGWGGREKRNNKPSGNKTKGGIVTDAALRRHACRFT